MAYVSMSDIGYYPMGMGEIYESPPGGVQHWKVPGGQFGLFAWIYPGIPELASAGGASEQSAKAKELNAGLRGQMDSLMAQLRDPTQARAVLDELQKIVDYVQRFPWKAQPVLPAHRRAHQIIQQMVRDQPPPPPPTPTYAPTAPVPAPYRAPYQAPAPAPTGVVQTQPPAPALPQIPALLPAALPPQYYPQPQPQPRKSPVMAYLLLGMGGVVIIGGAFAFRMMRKPKSTSTSITNHPFVYA